MSQNRHVPELALARELATIPPTVSEPSPRWLRQLLNGMEDVRHHSKSKNQKRYINVIARYGKDIAIDGLDFAVRKNTIFGIVGPANSGKTTLLKCINRTIDFIPSASVAGAVRVDGDNVSAKKLTKRMEEDQGHIKEYLDRQFMARFLERVGDHAKNICEDVVFAESAVNIRHGGQLPEA